MHETALARQLLEVVLARAREAGAARVVAVRGRVAETDVTLQTYADHRMATMAAVLALRIPGLEIADPQTTAKTMPDFVERWKAMLA